MCGVATIPFVIWYSKQRREWTRYLVAPQFIRKLGSEVGPT